MNQNHNANLLKKIEIGNPLDNLGLKSLLDKYNEAKTDQEIVDVYNHILDCVEGSTTAENVVYAMIAYSTSTDINPLYLKMIQKLNTNEA